jgi:hypothetical protein
VPPPKLTGYLHSLTHSVGRSRARFTRALGFDEVSLHLLEQGLLAIARAEEVVASESSPHGVRDVVSGAVATPLGTDVRLRTVWTVEASPDRSHFVTAYPQGAGGDV